MKLKRSAPVGSRVPTVLLPNAIRWEKNRARLFTELGDTEKASEATGLAFYYEKRAMDETLPVE